MLRRGEIHWALMPGDKRRPVLVLSPEARNERASDVIVVPLSTNLRAGPWHVRLTREDGGVPVASVIKCEQVTTLPRALLNDTPLGRPLSARIMGEVERAVLRAIGVPTP